MTIAHSTLTDPEIHEPKGASTATSGQVYAATGSGGGAWAKPFKYAGAHTGYSTGTPYVHAITAVDSVLNPTVTALNLSQFTVQSAPNFRLRYDGVEAFYGKVFFNCSFRQSDGADRNIQWVFYKNGSALAGSRIVVTTETAKWVNGTLIFDATLATNDYIEVFAQSTAPFNTDYAKIFVSIEGHVV